MHFVWRLFISREEEGDIIQPNKIQYIPKPTNKGKRQKTDAEYKQQVHDMHPGIEVIGVYQGCKNKVLHKCLVCQYEWEAWPSVILSGHGCPNCAVQRTKNTREDIEHWLQVTNSCFELTDNYDLGNRRIQLRCKQCGTLTETYASNICRSDPTTCRVCYDRGRVKNPAVYAAEFEEAVGDKYELLSEYQGCKLPVTIRRKGCGHILTVTAISALKLKGRCVQCEEEAYHKALDSLKDDPYVEVVKSEKVNKKTLFRCKRCGNEWYAYYGNVTDRGERCPKCKNLRISESNAKSHEQFVADLVLVNPTIEIIGKYDRCSKPVLVRCKVCGYEWSPVANSLLTGFGCPKCNMSHGERTIASYLDQQGIDYKPQKKFDDLIGTNGHAPSYDFYVPNYNLLIEYQGKQHYVAVDHFGGQKNFERQQQSDARKEAYALAHNFNFLKIKYDEDIIQTLEQYLKNLNSESQETVRVS